MTRDAEELRAQTYDSLATTLRSMGDAVITVDSHGAITFVNPAGERLLGMVSTAAVGTTLADMLPLPNRSRGGNLADLFLEGRTASARVELTLPSPDGELVVEHRINLLMGRDRATPSGAVVTLTDITARRKDELRSEFLAALGLTLTSTHTVVGVLDDACRAISPELAEECAICVMDRHSSELHFAAWPAAARQRLEERLAERSDSAATQKICDHFASDEVPTFLGHEREVVACIDGGRLVGVLQLFRPRRLGVDAQFAEEFGRRVALALDNAWLMEQLAAAVRVRDEFLAVVSHDLRNPLGSLVLVADGLREELGPHAGVENYAASIERAVERMNRLIQDLLDAEAISAGRLSVTLEEVRAESLLRECQALFASQARERDVDLAVEIESDLPPVRADRHRMLQVLSNLVSNAVKFADGGRVLLSAFRSPDGVRLAVTDDGPGIPPEHLPQLFDRFWSGDSTARGVGLGLAIAKGIVEAHGSQLVVASELGEGSRFEFELARWEERVQRRGLTR
jgi:PAS domain S-box-containing protein